MPLNAPQPLGDIYWDNIKQTSPPPKPKEHQRNKTNNENLKSASIAKKFLRVIGSPFKNRSVSAPQIPAAMGD